MFDVSAIPEDERIHQTRTPYYTAKVPVWVDTVEDPSQWAQMWRSMDGAKEVVEAVGAWIAVFEKPRSDSDLVGLSLSVLHLLSRV